MDVPHPTWSAFSDDETDDLRVGDDDDDDDDDDAGHRDRSSSSSSSSSFDSSGLASSASRLVCDGDGDDDDDDGGGGGVRPKATRDGKRRWRRLRKFVNHSNGASMLPRSVAPSLMMMM